MATLTKYPDMQPTVFELLDLARAKYLQLLGEENPDQQELASCQMDIQYLLGEMMIMQNAEKPKNSFAHFFRSIQARFVSASKIKRPPVTQPTVS